MTRQLEVVQEERELKRQSALVRALEFELPGILEMQGITLLGFAVKWDAYDCLLTLKADFGGKRQVAFCGGSSVVDSILKAVSAAKGERLRWKVDKYPHHKV